MNKDKPPMFVEGYDGDYYTPEELMHGIDWLLNEYNARDPGDGTYWEQYTLHHL